MKKIIFSAVGTLGLLAVVAIGVVQTGMIDIGADTPHGDWVTKWIGHAREQSISRRIADLKPPAGLANPERSRRGAGNYEAMCVGCHLSPGADDSEIRQGLYPQPPNLATASAEASTEGAARQFWIIKHGIMASGMPAWSKGGMDDAAIWDLVAFIQQLPKLSSEQYRQLVAKSDGHVHAGVENPVPAADRHDQKAPHHHDHGKHSH